MIDFLKILLKKVFEICDCRADLRWNLPNLGGHSQTTHKSMQNAENLKDVVEKFAKKRLQE